MGKTDTLAGSAASRDEKDVTENRRTARILYVEDNYQNMRLVRKILNHAGYEMLEAEDGLTALEVVASQSMDLILLDINLPDIDGLEVLARIREKQEFQALPIIALTANAMVGDREKMLAAGCSDYLPKPISRQELLDMVADHLPKPSAEK